MLYVKYMKLQTSRQKNVIIDKTELAGTKNILNRSNMELSRLTHICYKKILLLHVKYCNPIQLTVWVFIQQNTFINLVFIGW